MLGDRLGELFVVFERSKKILTRTVTAKAEEKAIRDDNYISPAGIELKTVQGLL